ncbi:hypothetical protein CBR_g8761 [Chara braunii]|nr:hypothetical protein CBR_g8761 [Chara braunii]|eukprot:GBG71341.1 hypothetical protein CBR_g8761 [Chara braunii]
MMAVAIGMVVLVAYAPTVAGARVYQCWHDTGHGPSTIKKIDCTKKPHAASVEGCQQKCDKLNKKTECEGMVYIHGPEYWESGKFCCFLKRAIEEESMYPEVHHVTCEALG